LIEEKQSEIIEYKIQQKELNEKYDNLCADLSEQISIRGLYLSLFNFSIYCNDLKNKN
jgi:hypothetical protein